MWTTYIEGAHFTQPSFTLFSQKKTQRELKGGGTFLARSACVHILCLVVRRCKWLRHRTYKHQVDATWQKRSYKQTKGLFCCLLAFVATVVVVVGCACARVSYKRGKREGASKRRNRGVCVPCMCSSVYSGITARKIPICQSTQPTCNRCCTSRFGRNLRHSSLACHSQSCSQSCSLCHSLSRSLHVVATRDHKPRVRRSHKY